MYKTNETLCTGEMNEAAKGIENSSMVEYQRTPRSSISTHLCQNKFILASNDGMHFYHPSNQ
jgi:hypothetical protein